MSCSFNDFLKILKGDFVCTVSGKRIVKENIDAEIYGNYCVASVKAEDGKLLIELKPFETVRTKYDPKEEWVKRHEEQFGDEPGFF